MVVQITVYDRFCSLNQLINQFRLMCWFKLQLIGLPGKIKGIENIDRIIVFGSFICPCDYSINKRHIKLGISIVCSNKVLLTHLHVCVFIYLCKVQKQIPPPLHKYSPCLVLPLLVFYALPNCPLSIRTLFYITVRLKEYTLNIFYPSPFCPLLRK